MEQLTVLLQKELRPSDVGNLGRIILPKVHLFRFRRGYSLLSIAAQCNGVILFTASGCFCRKKQSSTCLFLQCEEVCPYRWRTLTRVIRGILDTGKDNYHFLCLSRLLMLVHFVFT